jgi:hypothetical protein
MLVSIEKTTDFEDVVLVEHHLFFFWLFLYYYHLFHLSFLLLGWLLLFTFGRLA